MNLIFFQQRSIVKQCIALKSDIACKITDKVVNNNENSEKLSNVCKTLAKKIGEACVRRFYTRVSNVFNHAGYGKLLFLVGGSISN